MKKKKKRLSIKQRNTSFFMFTVGAVAVIFLIGIFGIFFMHGKNYYKIESRVNDIKVAKNSDNSDYDTIAWLRVQGTNIDFPIILGKKDDFEYPVQLESFAWSMGEDDKFHNKINIMGHNIFNLSSQPKKKSETFHRFEELMAFVYEDFAKDNKYIQLTIDGEDYLYKIYAVDFLYAADVILMPKGENTKEDLDEQIKLYKDKSLFDYDVKVDSSDKLISLVTCTRFFGTESYIDFVVNGRLVRPGEKIKNYRVVKNDKNYEKIEKILKGDDENEKTA